MGLHPSIETMDIFYGDGDRIIVPEIMKTVCNLKGSISESAVDRLTVNGKVTIGLFGDSEVYELKAKGFSWFLLILLGKKPNMSRSKLNLNKCPYTGSEHSTSWATLWHELIIGLKIRNIDPEWVQVAGISDILKELCGLEKTIETYQPLKPFGMGGFKAGEVPVIHAETKKEKDELHEGLSDTPQDTQAASGTATDIPVSVEKGVMYTAEQVEHIIKTILQYKGIAG